MWGEKSAYAKVIAAWRLEGTGSSWLDGYRGITPMTRLLLTGFEPFGQSPVNPSQLLATQLAGEMLPGVVTTLEILPVIGGTRADGARACLKRAIERDQPDTVVCLGESAKASHISFERVAVNLRDERIADNAGSQVRDEPVVPGAPAAYFSSLPVREMRDACEGEGVPALLSMSAGTFLCNEIMYWTLHSMALGEIPSVRRSGFVHLPQLPMQALKRGGPSMELEAMVVGMRPSLLALASPWG